MLDNVQVMFDDRKAIVGKLKKATYEANMPIYREKYGDFFNEMTQFVAGSEDVNGAADELATCFCDKVFDAFNKRGKVSSGMVFDLNFVMIYYIFPALLLTEDENATVIADAITGKWNEKFGCTIQYGTYDLILSGFKTKLFGFF